MRLRPPLLSTAFVGTMVLGAVTIDMACSRSGGSAGVTLGGLA